MKRVSWNDNWTVNGEAVTLPHDAMLHTDRRPDAPSGSAGAFFAGGEWVYEKRFQKPRAEHAILHFEGVYKNARVYVNGTLAGGAAYGYIPFFVYLDKYLTEGENTVRVECAVEEPQSRWYSGAGIYRPVWLYTGNGDVIEPESVKIDTVSTDPVIIRVKSAKKVTASVDGVTGEGESFELTIPSARLWSENDPYLYTAKVRTADDEAEVRFGIRKIEWSPKGLFINGRETLLRGGCIHHDSGVLGAATYDEAERRRVRILKNAGFNAIRSAHNPASRALLDACDELGVYVMDETWDMWYHAKTKFDYASQWRDNYIADIDALVSRDYNHPSVIMYSIGNEVSEPAKSEGIEKTREMAEHIHAIDPARAVTGGFNLMIISNAAKGKEMFDTSKEEQNADGEKKLSGMSSTMFNLITSFVGTGMNSSANSKGADAATSPSLKHLDICGYNYASGRYAIDGKAHPERVIVGSETFPQTLAKNWAMVKKYPYLIGDFMWTAWDYMGEAGIGAWAFTPDGKGFSKPYPWLLGDTGAFDILGDPNGEALWASAVWGKGSFIAVQPINHSEKPIKGVWRGTNAIPSWSWRGCEGKEATVEVYTEGTRVELYLNGKLAGKARAKDCRATFKVKYDPGRLEAVCFDLGGREIARCELSSAKGAELTIKPEKNTVKSGEIVYIPVIVADESGNVEANADEKVSVSVEGGELLGFGSANPRTEERFDRGEYATYYGRALAVVRAGECGAMKVTANGKECEIEVVE